MDNSLGYQQVTVPDSVFGINTEDENLTTKNNVWKGTNEYNIIPTCPAQISDYNNDDQLVNKRYADNIAAGTILDDVNTWTEQNTFNKAPQGPNYPYSIVAGTAANNTQLRAKLCANNTDSIDTNINGTISGESIYNHIMFGDRWVIGTGNPTSVISGKSGAERTYIGSAGSGVPDPDMMITISRGIGVKLSPAAVNTGEFNEALRVIGISGNNAAYFAASGGAIALSTSGPSNLSGNVTIAGNATLGVDTDGDTAAGNPPKNDHVFNGNATAGTNHFTITSSSTNKLIIQGSLFTGAGVTIFGNPAFNGTPTFANLPTCSAIPSANNQLVNKAYVDGHPTPSGKHAGIFYGSGASNTPAWTPIFFSMDNVQLNFMDYNSYSSATFAEQDTSKTSAGSYQNLNMGNGANFFMVYPDWGIIAYNNGASGGGSPSDVLLNYKNTSSKITIVKPSAIDQIEAWDIYYDNTKITEASFYS